MVTMVDTFSAHDVARFMTKVDQGDECWMWKGGRYNTDYGRFCANARMYLAHRASYEIFVGPIPEGAFILHSCDNPPCVNPAHLRAGDHRENMADMKERGRAKSPCLAGERHPHARLSEDDVREIRRRYASGKESQQRIADDFGVRQTLISQIVLRQAWRHVA